MTQERNKAYWEIAHSIQSKFPKAWTKQELIDLASKAEIHLIGWPIGAVLNRQDARPKIINSGIAATIHSGIDDMYDYWELQINGNFYHMRLLEESLRGYNGGPVTENVFHFDTRIRRISEALLHCKKMYELMEAKANDPINFQVNYTGLEGRQLKAADFRRNLWEGYIAKENAIEVKRSCSIELISADLKGLVYDITKETFEYFQWLSYNKQVCDDIVEKFLQGQS